MEERVLREAEERHGSSTEDSSVAPARTRVEGEGKGYDCEFVEPPPTAFQTVCPVCQLVLREPHLISCCGQKICRQCLRVEESKEEEKSASGAALCQLCGEPRFTHLQDRGLERSMKELLVRCTFKKHGCEWVGKLGELEKHLKQDATDSGEAVCAENTECPFVEVECRYDCGEWFKRRHIATHQSQQCPKRPYTCDHCHAYQSVFVDVVENHYPQCSKYPTPCPNHCQESTFERQELESHLQKECPLVLVKCPYEYAGCNNELLRKDVPNHIETGTATHLTLLARVTESLTKSNTELRGSMGLVHELNVKQVSMITECSTRHQQQKQVHTTAFQELNKHIVQLTATTNALVTENSELRQCMEEKDRQYSELTSKLSTAVEEIQSLKDAVKTLKINTAQRSEFPKEFRVKVTSANHFSQAFYTHPHGYRMCLRVCPKGITGSESHVSVYTYMMQGPFDKHLHWPFVGEVTVQIVNQTGDHDHVERIISFSTHTPGKHSRRVKGREISQSGWGKRYFLPHEQLYNSAREVQYLKNNHLLVRILKVKVL